jgi:hypothetical protein
MIHVYLTFAAYEPIPSPQTHSLYSGAQAFFRFPCPCADCDGEFDLTETIRKLAVPGSGNKAGRSHSGNVKCGGMFWHDSQRSTPCPIQLHFEISVKPLA